MRFLIISGAFYPGDSPRAFRTTELAKELSRQGHEVKVIAFSTNPKVNKFDFGDFTREFNISVSIIPQKWHLLNSQSIIARIINRFLMQFVAYPDVEILHLLPMVFKQEGKYDAMISIAVPHQIHWSLARRGKDEIHKRCDTWIADCGDPFMLCKTTTYKQPFYFKWIEKSWCKQCDYITVPTDTAHLGYYPEFKEKIKVIPQGFNFEETPLKEYRKNEIPTFAYAGGFLKMVRDPSLFLQFLSKIDKPFKFIIFCKGSELLDPYKPILGDKIQIEKQIPRENLLPILSQMDFLVNFGNGTTVQTPSKLIDYTLAKRPILTVESNNIREDVVMEFLEGDYQHKDAEIDISRYDIHRIAKQFVELCKTK